MFKRVKQHFLPPAGGVRVGACSGDIPTAILPISRPRSNAA